MADREPDDFDRETALFQALCHAVNGPRREAWAAAVDEVARQRSLRASGDLYNLVFRLQQILEHTRNLERDLVETRIKRARARAELRDLRGKLIVECEKELAWRALRGRDQ